MRDFQNYSVLKDLHYVQFLDFGQGQWIHSQALKRSFFVCVPISLPKLDWDQRRMINAVGLHVRDTRNKRNKSKGL